MYIYQNTSTQHNSFDHSLVWPGLFSIILGNLNGHSQIWNLIQPQDQRGDEILDWILDNDLYIRNEGAATRTSRIAGNDGNPHIFLCGSNWSAKTSWRLAEPIASTYLFSKKLIVRSTTSLSSRELLDGDKTASSGRALRTKSSRKWATSLTNQTYLFVCLVSVTLRN